jgi:uncharacterized membrane protein
MDDLAGPFAGQEYQALRDTIRDRGTARIVLFVAVMGIWGALVVATASALTLPVASLIPLVVLGAGFEAVASLHIAVERVGRYIQVRYEEDFAVGSTAAPQTWERTSMEWGKRFPGSGTDPLFTTSFLLAIVVNYLPAAFAGEIVELVLLAVAHGALAWRMTRVRGWASRQRAEDLDRFRALLAKAQGDQ